MPDAGCFGKVSGLGGNGERWGSICSPGPTEQPREVWLESEVRRLQKELEHKEKDNEAMASELSGKPAEKPEPAKQGGADLAVEQVKVHFDLGTSSRGVVKRDAEDVADVMHEESVKRASVNFKLPSEMLGNMSSFFAAGFDSSALANSLLGFKKPLRVAIYIVALGGVVFILISQSLHLGAHHDDHGDDHGADHGADAGHGDAGHRMLYGMTGRQRRLGGGASNTMIYIAFTLTAAGVITLIMQVLGLPLILGYLLGGVAVGPIGLKIVASSSEIGELSNLGLIFLLFMIGLELDVKELLKMGKVVLVTGFVQYPVCFGLMYAIFAGLHAAGLSWGDGEYPAMYLGMVCGISSTMIVVKLLSEKCETDSVPGRLTIGILIFQDIWAIIILAVQPNLANPEPIGILKTFGMIAVLICVSLLYAKFVMPAVLFYASKSVELMLVLSLAWCFFIGCIAIQPYIGLSMELAALIAGVALATFPYSAEFNGKIKYIRDFFITLFFAGLGMQIPVPAPEPILKAFLVAFVVVLVRPVGIFLMVFLLGGGEQLGALATINLSQISEFALVICSLGKGFDHIREDTLTIIIWVFTILAISATYMIQFNAIIYRALAARIRKLVGARSLEEKFAPQDEVTFSLTVENLDCEILDENTQLKSEFENVVKESIMDAINPHKSEELKSATISLITSLRGTLNGGTHTQVDATIHCGGNQSGAVAKSIQKDLGNPITMKLSNISGIRKAELGDISVSDVTEATVVAGHANGEHGGQDIILLGFHRIAFMLVAEFQAKSPEMLKHLHVIDLNQGIMPALRKKGVKCTYGDICAPDVLQHCHHGDPSLVICTIPDSLLQGVTNAKLLKIAQEVWPTAHYIVTADNPQQATQLYSAGADYVLRSAKLCAERLQDLLTKHRRSISSAESELAHLFNSYRAKDKDKRTSFIQQRLH